MTSNPVRIAIGNITFDHATDDGRGDVLLARRRPPGGGRLARNARGPRCPYNADRDVIGVTIVNARCLLDRDGKFTITIPERIDVSAAALAAAMASAAA
jgi:hypothetical protein